MCGPTTLERSDRRRSAYPEMAVYEGELKGTHITKQPENRHEWVCGPTTLERSDRRRLAYPEMAVSEGEFEQAIHNQNHPKFTTCTPGKPVAGSGTASKAVSPSGCGTPVALRP